VPRAASAISQVVAQHGLRRPPAGSGWRWRVAVAVAALAWVTLLGLKLAAIASDWLCRAVILGALAMGIGPVQLLRAALDRSLGG
jgi:hypothetical protein